MKKYGTERTRQMYLKTHRS